MDEDRIAELRQYFELSERPQPYRVCAESVYGFHSDPDVDGKCLWCRHKISAKMQRPLPPIGYVPDLDEAYERMYDPNW